MEQLYVDLHVHTSFSDGTFLPEEAVQHAKSIGLAAISITDHDITDGIPGAIAEGVKTGVEVIPGIELSAQIEGDDRGELHILGYCIDWQDSRFQEALLKFRQDRRRRADAIIAKLGALGMNLNEEHLRKIAGKATIGRLHFAKVMIEEGHVRSITDAFQLYLGYGKPAYEPKLRLKPEEAIKMILDVGGIPVLAHPHYVHFTYPNLINDLVDWGLKGIEVWHSKHPPASVKKFSALAEELGLISTGGSDCHGRFADDTPQMGKVKIPYRVVTELKKYKKKIDRDRAPQA